MAEANLTSLLLESVIEKLSKAAIEEIVILMGVDKEVKKLSEKLLVIQSVLNDAEEQQQVSEAVISWLGMLSDVAYNVDDILDLFATKALQSRIQVNQREQVCNFITCSAFKTLLFRLKMSHQIKNSREMIDEIAKEINDLSLIPTDVDGGTQVNLTIRRETISFIDESDTVGREEDRKKLLELLASEEVGGKDVKVISIVGMGGLGKTTLAQLVYNDEIVKKQFELRMWVCVSEDFDVKRLTKAIICFATGTTCDLEDLDRLQTKLKEVLNGKRFLLVLDDVWNDNESKWDALRVPLTVGAKGSVVMVTTRSELVSSLMGTILSYRLGLVTDDESWSLFKNQAFGRESSAAHTKLEEIGKEIVKKCGNLPLAIKSLARVLAYTRDELQWKNILVCEIWDLPAFDIILPVLKLSYNYLPPHLKQCFVYCSLFSKGYLFEKIELIHLWMGEGFIQPKGSKPPEDIGLEYFDDLLSRSFFQPEKEMYKMHDLMHDLAVSISNRIFVRFRDDMSCHISMQTRHLSMIRQPINFKSPNFEECYKLERLRTILINNVGNQVTSIPHEMFLKWTWLRVLDLRWTGIRELPNSIGKLKHLRYLNLSERRIEMLPESMSALCNLQTLKLRGCSMLLQLPKDTKNLINLRHLTLDDCNELISMPPGIGKLKSLQTLTKFIVSEKSGCGIEELKDMTELCGEIKISGLENVSSVEAAKEANLNNKKHLHKLILQWSYFRNSDSDDEIFEEVVLEALHPHTNLKELSILNYCGVRFPSWISEQFSNLVYLYLANCSECKSLAPFGQLPSLKVLEFKWMENLEELSGVEEDEFPCLLELTIYGCDKLRVMPNCFASVTKLKIEDCKVLSSLPRLPSLRELTLTSCHGMVLNSVHCFTSLSFLSISRFDTLKSIPNGLLQPLIKLQDLEISECKELEYFPEEDWLRHHTSLHRVHIIGCKFHRYREMGF